MDASDIEPAGEETTGETVKKSSKAALGIIFLTVFIDLLGFGIVLPLLPRYGGHFGASGWMLGLLMSVFSLMQFLFAPLWGRLSDRVGRRPILMVGLGGSTVSYAMFGYATSLGNTGELLGLSALVWLFITRTTAGIAGATIPTAQAYIADNTDARNRGKGMAMIGAAFGAGFTFGPLIGAAFVTADPNGLPSAAPGYVAAVLSGFALLSAIFLLPESRKAGSVSAVHRRFNMTAFRLAMAKGGIAVVLGALFLTTFAFAEFESTLSKLTEELGMAERQNFYLFAYIGLVLTIAQGGLVRRLLPKWGEYKMAIVGVTLMITGFLLIAWSGQRESTGLLYAVLPVCVIGYSALNPSLQALISLRTSEDEQGQMLGLGQSFSALARILGPLIGIKIFDDVSILAPYWCAAAVMGLGALLIITLKPAKNQLTG